MAKKVLVLSVKQAAQALEVTERLIRKRIQAEQLASRTGEDGFIKVPLSALKKSLAPERYAAIKARLENGENPIPVTAPVACKSCKVKTPAAEKKAPRVKAKGKKGKK